jgi:cell division protein FtsL
MRYLTKRVRGLISLTIAVTIVLGLFLSFPVGASDSVTMELKTILQPVTAYDSMSEDGKAVGKIDQGEPVIILSQEGDWFEIMYMGESVYVRGSEAELFGTRIDENAAEELEERAETSRTWVESYQAQKNAMTSARIWRVMIVVFIIAVIGVVIISSILKAKKDKETTGNTDNIEEEITDGTDDNE